MIENLLIIITISTVLVFILSWYIDKLEKKRVSRIDNKSLPRRIKVNQSVGQYRKEVIKAIKYINESLEKEIFTLK